MNDILILSVVFFGSLLSGIIAFYLNRDRKRNLTYLLSFSGAFLIGISFLVIVPEIFGLNGNSDLGLWILCGFLLQLLLDILTRGIEHGHLAGHEHHHDHDHIDCTDPPQTVFHITVFVGLCLHAFLEGMPFVSTVDKDLQASLMAGIVVHNIPITIVLVGFFLHSGMKKTNILLLLTLFSLMTPLGGICSNAMRNLLNIDITAYNNVIMAFVVGIFLHVSTSILFEAGENHKYNFVRFFTVLAGISIAFAVSVISH